MTGAFITLSIVLALYAFVITYVFRGQLKLTKIYYERWSKMCDENTSLVGQLQEVKRDNMRLDNAIGDLQQQLAICRDEVLNERENGALWQKKYFALANAPKKRARTTKKNNDGKRDNTSKS